MLNLLAVVSFSRASLDASIFSVFQTGEEYTQNFFHLAEKYGGTDTVLIVVTAENKITSKESLLSFWSYFEAVRAVEGITYAATFLPPVIPGKRMLKPTDRESIEREYTTVLAMIDTKGGMSTGFLSEDRKTGGIQVSMAGNTFNILKELRSVPGPPGMKVIFTGSQIVFETLWNTLLRIIFIFPPITIIILLTIFYLNIRSKKLTLIALLPAVFGALWMLQTLFWSGIPLNIMLVVTPIFVIVMGSADGLHFVIHYLQNVDRYKDRLKLTESTLREVGIPILLTTATTMVGFLSLCSSSIKAIWQMGLFTSLGIAYAGLISLFFLPALLYRIELQAKYKQGALSQRILKFLIPLTRRPFIPILVFSGIVVCSLIAIPKLEVYSDQLLFFRKHSEIRKNFEYAEKKLGSNQLIFGEFVLGEGNLADSKQIEKIYYIEREMERIDGIYRVYSIVDMLKYLYETRMGREGFPPDKITRMMLNFLPEDIPLVSDDGLLFYAFTKDWKTETLTHLMEFARAHDAVRTISGMPVIFSRLNELVVETQKSSLLITAAGVFLLLLILFRSFKSTLVAMLPMGITVTGIYGLLYITDFQLNILTVTISSIAVGVGIDYAIHLIFSIQYNRKQNAPLYTVRALNSTGIPILANAMGVGLGLMPLIFSPLFVHVQVATVIGFAMLASSLSALIIIPIFYPGGLRTHISSG
jgi:predicted RND superfamily exporter protein